MKKIAKLFVLPAAALILAACGGETSSSAPSSPSSSEEAASSEVVESTSSSESSSTTSSSIVEEATKYTIQVSAPSGIVTSLSADSAAKGERVTLTIEMVPQGYTVTGVTMNGEPLASSDGKTYAFTMPGRSVRLVVSATVDGDVTLSGDVTANLTLNPETGIYEAKGVKVDVSSNKANFSFNVKGKDGTTTKVGAYELDETRSFGDIGVNFSGDENLNVASGSTYDFYYDPASPVFKCYVVRTKVDTLPNSASALGSLFNTGLSIRSESALNPTDVRGMNLEVNIPSEGIDQTLTMKSYDDESTLTTVEDELQGSYVVYKAYDEEKETLQIVDDYLRDNGNNDNSKDRSNAYSGTYPVVDDAFEEDEATYEYSKREAKHLVNNAFPYAMKYLEGDIMEAYRSGFESDEVTSSSIIVTSAPSEDGFTTAIDSYVEYDATAGTYTDEIHEGHVYKAELGFTEAGAIASIDFTATVYNESQWDFANHAPLAGQRGMVEKKISGTYEYGAKYDASEKNFDPSPYFVQEFTKLRFFNPDAGLADDGTSSVIAYRDKLRLSSFYDDETVENVEMSYLPATALDAWQYTPVASDNEGVIARTSSDGYMEMTAVGIDKEQGANVTFGNQTKDGGAAKTTVNVKVWSTSKFHTLVMDWTTNGLVDWEDNTMASIYGGTTDSFDLLQYPETAPLVYEAESENPDVLEIVSTGDKLVLQAAPVDEVTTVRIAITSDWYDFEGTDNAIFFTFNVLPSSRGIVGTSWTVTDPQYTPSMPDTHVVFTDEEYAGNYDEDVYTAPKMGYVSDLYIEAGTEDNPATVEHHDKYYFYYEFSQGVIRAKIYDVEADGLESIPASDFEIDLEFDATNDTLNVALYYGIDDMANYTVNYYEILGVLEEGTPILLIPFSRDATYTE